MYYTNTDSKKPHMAFIGRWCPLHRGHTWIIEQKLKEVSLPILVLVRDTNFDQFPAEIRAELVRLWMEDQKIKGTIIIIPDINGVYYGRGVGYNVTEIEPPEDIKTISATKIREMISSGDVAWKEIVAPGTADYLETMIGEYYDENA